MTGPVDEGDRFFEYQTRAIEEIYRDLLGIEAVSNAVIAAYGEADAGRDPQIGIRGDGPAGVIHYTMPTREPFQVPMRLDELSPGQVAAQLDPIFHAATGNADGTAAFLQGLVNNIYGVDNVSIARKAADQYQAVFNATGKLKQNFAHIEVAMTRHWIGDTAEAWAEYYDSMTDVIFWLLQYAGVAQIGAAGTAATIQQAKVSLSVIGRQGREAFEHVLAAWKSDAVAFPFQPGLSHVELNQFFAALANVEEFAKKIPGPIGKVAETVGDGVEKAEKVVGVVNTLIEPDEQRPVEVASRAKDLLSGLSLTLVAKSDDVYTSTERLAKGTTPHLQRMGEDKDLVLPTGHPQGHYVP